jgi:hypothetical protein
MEEFKGTIQLEDGDGLETSLTVDGGRLLMTAGEHEIGNWAIEELSAERRNSEIRLRVEGDELVVGAVDPIGLSQALGITNGAAQEGRGKKPRTKKRLKRKERSQPEESRQVATVVAETPVAPAVDTPEPVPVVDQSGENEPSWWTRLSLRTKLIGAGLVGLVVLGVLAPTLLALLLMLAGMVTLFLAIAAKGEGGAMTFLPPPFFATTTAGVGGIALVLLAIAIMVVT